MTRTALFPKKKAAPPETAFEKGLKKIALDAWDKAVEDYFFPALAKPKLVLDPTRTEGFYIDTLDWRVTMNLLQIPAFPQDSEIFDYVHSISQHEIGHYDLCPYDGVTNAELMSAAMKKVPEHFAPLVVNIFADLVIDTQLHNRFPKLTGWRQREGIKDVILHAKAPVREHGKKRGKNAPPDPEKRGGDFSGTWKILVKACEHLWSADLGLQGVDTSEVDAKARRVADIIAPRLLDQSTWPEKVKKVAAILKPNLDEDFTLQVGLAHGRGSGQGVGLEGPEDYERQFGDPSEVKSKEKVQGKDPSGREGDVEKFAKGRNFKDFGGPARLSGIIKDGSTLAAWYRGRSRDLISIRIYDQKPGGALPAYPESWRLGDPVEDLDIVLSLQVCPKIIPNITTRKWHFKEGPSHLVEKVPPDLLVVLDSSGSMNWNPDGSSQNQRGEYDIALVSAFAAAHYAFSRGCKVAALNFSDIAIKCDWTSDYLKVENALLQYQGGGTVIPLPALRKLVYDADRHVLIFIITDFGLNNFNASIKAFIEVAEAGNYVTGFFIGANPDDFALDPRFEALRARGISFYPVHNVKDLVGLVIEEIRKFYSPAGASSTNAPSSSLISAGSEITPK